MPQPGHGLGDANIVGLKRVEGNTKSNGSDAESPHGQAADERDTVLREVVDNACPKHISWLLVSTSHGGTYSNPMCECTTKSAQRIESVTGLSDPAAKGARVKGMRPAETILCRCQLMILQDMMQKPWLALAALQKLTVVPLETPVVAAMSIVWLGHRHRVVGGSDNLLG